MLIAGHRIPPRTLRIAVWGAICALLIAPLLAMQFTNEVAWTGSDFRRRSDAGYPRRSLRNGLPQPASRAAQGCVAGGGSYRRRVDLGPRRRRLLTTPRSCAAPRHNRAETNIVRPPSKGLRKRRAPVPGAPCRQATFHPQHHGAKVEETYVADRGSRRGSET